MKPKLTNTAIVSLADGMMVADLGNEAVLLHGRSGTYFGLNEVGAGILSRMGTPQPVAGLVEALLREYDVSPAQLERDVLAFLEDMASRELIEVVHEVAA